MSYPVIGANATVGSWGSANQNATILSNIIPASARYSLSNNGQDITGLGAFAVSEMPGLHSAGVTIGGLAGASATLGTSIQVAYSGGTVAPYALSMQSLSLVMRTPTVHDITAGSSGSPATFMSFRPDIFQCAARFTALVDSGTPITLPDTYGNTLNSAVFTYMSGGTLTLTGHVRTLEQTAIKGGKQLVTYGIGSVGTVVSAGGLFGVHTFGGTNNADPLWSAGGAATGALVLNMLGAGTRKITFTDSFWTSIAINATAPGQAVGVEIAIQPSGTYAFT